MTHCPETAPIMQIAWRDCLLWTIHSEEPDFLAMFTADTGVKVPGPRTGLDILIDQATGNDAAQRFVEAYVPWFNQRVWGETIRQPTINMLERMPPQ